MWVYKLPSLTLETTCSAKGPKNHPYLPDNTAPRVPSPKSSLGHLAFERIWVLALNVSKVVPVALLKKVDLIRPWRKMGSIPMPRESFFVTVNDTFRWLRIPPVSPSLSHDQVAFVTQGALEKVREIRAKLMKSCVPNQSSWLT